MPDKTDISKPRFSIEWLLGGSLSRIGDIIDRFTRRSEVPKSSLATSQLIDRLKRLLDAKVKEIPGKGKVIPHNIDLRIQWDKFATDDNDTIERLQQELLTATVDHINDSHFYTLEPINLRVSPDYFTEGVKLLVSFDKFGEAADSNELNITIPAGHLLPPEEIETADKAEKRRFVEVWIKPRSKPVHIEVPADGRITVGRAANNHLTIDDPSMSKYHGSISINSDAQILVADTGSTNGTFINGQRIAYGKGNVIGEGDIVKFGAVEVTLKVLPKTSESGLEEPHTRGEIGNNADASDTRGQISIDNELEELDPNEYKAGGEREKA